MIRYTLRCVNDHSFDSWFQSASAFDTLVAAGMTGCPDCGSTDVQKAIMAPRVRPGRSDTRDAIAAPEQRPSLTTPETGREAAVSRLKAEIEANSEYVGMNFANEARAMHSGKTPGRAIYGEAKPADAKSLIEDGVPVAPLPFTPKRKAH